MILLDTHAWLWARSSPDKLSERARSLIDSEPLSVSSISCWEVATLVRLGRLDLDRSIAAWVGQALADAPHVSPIPVSPEIATVAGALDNSFPGDPADRIIFATALQLKYPLLTRDRRMRAYSPGHTLWD